MMPIRLALLNPIDDPVAACAIRAERAFLQRLGSGCALPVAAYAHAIAGAIGGCAGGCSRWMGAR